MSCCSCEGRETEAREMTESERAVIPQAERPSISEGGGGKRGGGGDRERERDGLLKSRVHLSHSFLFILLVCFFSPLISNIPPSLLISSPIFNTLSLCPLSISRPPASTHPPALLRLPPSSLFSSLCLPREKRFCLLLVSAPSQSAFLISSYCFCLIFKCYPRPNGNPYKKKKRRRRSGEE